MSEEDREYMSLAETLAKSRPDPIGGKCVGAIIVKDDHVISFGTRFTIKPYGSLVDRTIHAEHMAIDCAGPAATGATLYCTMELCLCRVFRKNWFMDKPCVEQIIAAGIRRVAFIESDYGSGKGGAESLRAAGIVVEKIRMPKT